MSIEKLDFETIEREHVPFVMVATNVIQQIKNPMAGFIWVYFSSLPPEWKINKAHIMKHFELSERSYQRYMSYLKSHNLIEYRRYRFENGTLGPVTLVCLNGLNFKPDVDSDHTAKFGIVVINHTAKTPRSGESTAVVSGTLINTTTSFGSIKRKDLLNIGDSTNTPIDKNLISSKNKKEKQKSDYRQNELFMRFYQSYPKKQKPQDAYKAFLRLNADEGMVDMIIADALNRRANDDHWQDIQFIPYPATYLNAKQWEGDICNSVLEKESRKLEAKKISEANFAKIEEASLMEANKPFQITKEAINAKKILDKATGYNSGWKDILKVAKGGFG